MTEPIIHDSPRPASVRNVFLATAAKILLSFVFIGVFSLKGNDPTIIAATSAAYIALAIPMFVSIHKRNGVAVRALIVVAMLASIPARAALGVLLDIVALGFTLHPDSRSYFAHP